MRDWYIARCLELGQSTLAKFDCVYNTFSNGERITDAHRLLYRDREDLDRDYPDPFDVGTEARSYFHWYLAHGSRPQTRPFFERISNNSPPCPAAGTPAHGFSPFLSFGLNRCLGVADLGGLPAGWKGSPDRPPRFITSGMDARLGVGSWAAHGKRSLRDRHASGGHQDGPLIKALSALGDGAGSC